MGNDQVETLISYMEQHTLFARGQITKLGAQGHLKYKTMWTVLAEQLNQVGPSQKDVAGWQEVSCIYKFYRIVIFLLISVYNCSFQSWKKMRLNAKLKKATFLKALNRTGHDTPDAELNENDERISQIYGTYGTRMSIGRELGFKRIESNNCGESTHYLLQFKMCFNLKCVSI